MYTFDTTVSYSRLDKNGNVPYYEIMNYLQDCSTFQSEELGVGAVHMKSVNKAWVVLGYKIKFLEPLKFGDKITIGTAATEFGKVFAKRQYCIQNQEKKFLVKAETIWALIDLDTRIPLRVSEEEAGIYPLEKIFDDVNVSRKLKLSENKKALPVFRVGRADIDGNGHMNNANYLRAAEEYLPEVKNYKELEIIYNKEAMEGETIIPYIHEEENGIGISFESESGDVHTKIRLI